MLFAVVAAAAAAPQDKPLVKILSQSFDQDDQGSYQFAYELDNGQKVGWFLGTCSESSSLLQRVPNFMHGAD